MLHLTFYSCDDNIEMISFKCRVYFMMHDWNRSMVEIFKFKIISRTVLSEFLPSETKYIDLSEEAILNN